MFLTHDYKEDKNKNTNRDTSKTEEKAKHKFKEPERKSGEMSHEDTGTEVQKLKTLRQRCLCQEVRRSRRSANA